ncbi:clp protease regulatory subunit clpx1 [Quercus suber]|uniref:Clp protease regulatory subunit clpx1 n=1 Tax=Quercus suber TaxID=58331 RepID=A0AAW0LK08_QUESU
MVRPNSIQSNLDELVKVVNEHCKKYGLLSQLAEAEAILWAVQLAESLSTAPVTVEGDSQAEAEAILWAVQLAESLSTAPVTVEGDSQMDTKNILFICGGPSVDLEKTISERQQDSSIGFGAPVHANMRIGGSTKALASLHLFPKLQT